MTRMEGDAAEHRVVARDGAGDAGAALGASYQLLTFTSPTLSILLWLENITATELIVLAGLVVEILYC